MFYQDSSVYSLISKTDFKIPATDCQGVFLPFHPGFTYVAYPPIPGEDSSVGMSVFGSKQEFLLDYNYVKDVSSRKV